MTVHELIQQLQSLERPDADVWAEIDCEYSYACDIIRSATIDNVGDVVLGVEEIQ